MKRIPKNITLLGVAFSVIFFAFNGIQQFITSYFASMNVPQTGFYSLILVYLFFTVSEPLSAIFVSRYGAKRSMQSGILFYSLYILSLATGSQPIIYTASVLLGCAASLLWTGQNSYLVRASGESSRGANAGFFSTLLAIGSAVGVTVLGFFIGKLPVYPLFIAAGIIPLIGLYIVSRLSDFPKLPARNHFLLLTKAATSKTAWQLSAYWFSVQFIYGLAIGQIPIEIKNTLGIEYVGLSSVFYLMPIALSYAWGNFSDRRGRKSALIISFALTFFGLGLLYISDSAVPLIAGMVLLAVNYALGAPLTMALTGDVSTERNLEYLTALFWMVQNIGAVSALLLSTAVQSKYVYLVAIMIFGAVFAQLLPLLRSEVSALKERITRETNG